MQTDLPTIISDSYVLVIQKTTFDRKVSKWFASTNWSQSFLFPHPSHMPWLSDSICETSDSKKVVRNEKMGSHEFHEEVIDIQVFKDGSGRLPVRGFGASEPKTGPGWVQIPGWGQARCLGRDENPKPITHMWFQQEFAQLWDFKQHWSLLSYGAKEAGQELRGRQRVRWACRGLIAPLGGLISQPHSFASAEGEDLVLGWEPASDKALQSLWMCLTTKILISKPHWARKLNRAWNIIISPGLHVDLPFISDSVNLLSPKQNLIKIPVFSELQSIFFLLHSLLSLPFH